MLTEKQQEILKAWKETPIQLVLTAPEPEPKERP